MKSIFSLFFVFPAAQDTLIGQDVYEMVINAIAPDDQMELNQNLKSLYSPGYSAVRSLQLGDCELLKDSLRSLNVVVQEYFLKQLIEELVKFVQDSQMKALVEMAKSMILSQMDHQIDHIIEHQACDALVGRDEL